MGTKFQLDKNELMNKAIQAVVILVLVSACGMIWKGINTVDVRIASSENRQMEYSKRQDAIIKVVDDSIKDLSQEMEEIRNFHKTIEKTQEENIKLIKTIIEMLEKKPPKEITDILEKRTLPDTTVPKLTSSFPSNIRDIPPIIELPKYNIEDKVNRIMEQRQVPQQQMFNR